MDLELADKVALITGASRGIGRAIAEGLAAEGARLVIAARGAEALEEAEHALEAMGADVLAVIEDRASREASLNVDVMGAVRLVEARAGAYRRDGWARRRRSPRLPCGWSRRGPAGSTARPWLSTAGSRRGFDDSSWADIG